MPPHNWAQEPTEIVQQFERRHKVPEAGALLAWAVWSVDCLHYLDDVDSAFDASRRTGGHRPDIIDVSHVRWATGTCITALDLCAAGLARAFCGQTGDRELDLEDFNPGGKPSAKRTTRRSQLPVPAQTWIDGVCADPDYATIKAARNWLTHSLMARHFSLGGSGPPPRLSLSLPSSQTPVRQIVELSRDFATRHVASFLNLLPTI